MVRSLVLPQMQQAAVDTPHVWDLAGMIIESGFSGKDHDAILYGRKPGEPAIEEVGPAT